MARNIRRYSCNLIAKKDRKQNCVRFTYNYSRCFDYLLKCSSKITHIYLPNQNDIFFKTIDFSCVG